MADQNVKIKIGSSWNGQGASQAASAVNSLAQVSGKAAGAVGRIGSAFNVLGGEASKAVGALSSFASAFATGGVIGVAMAGITGLISAWQTLNGEIAKTNEAKFDKVIAGLKEVNTAATKAAESLGKEGDKLKQVNTAQGKAKSAQVKSEEGKAAVDAETELKNLEVDYNTAKKKVEEFKFAEDRLKESVESLKKQYADEVAKMQTGTGNSIWGASGGGSGALSSIKKALDEAEKELKAARQKRRSAMASIQAKETQIEEARANLYMQEELARQEIMSKMDGEAEATENLERAKIALTAEMNRLTREQEQQRYQDLLAAQSEEVDATERLARAKIALAEQTEQQTLNKGFEAERKRLTEWNDAQEKVDGIVMVMKMIQADLKDDKNLTEAQRADLKKQLDNANSQLEEIKKKNPNVNVDVNLNGGNGNGGNGGNGNGGNMPNVRDVLDGNNPLSPFAPRNDFGLFGKPKGHDRRKIKSHADWLRRRGFDPDDLLRQLEEPKKKKVELGDQTVNKFKTVINDAQKPHIAK